MGNMEVLFENVTKEQDNCDIVGSGNRCCVCRTGKNNVHYKVINTWSNSELARPMVIQ